MPLRMRVFLLFSMGAPAVFFNRGERSSQTSRPAAARPHKLFQTCCGGGLWLLVRARGDTRWTEPIVSPPSRAAAGLLRQLACCCISGATVSTIHDKLARMCSPGRHPQNPGEQNKRIPNSPIPQKPRLGVAGPQERLYIFEFSSDSRELPAHTARFPSETMRIL